MDLALLVAYWGAYFLMHSLLASLAVKRTVARHCPSCMPAYRLFFNVAAVVLILPPVVWARLHPGEMLWAWNGPWRWLAHALGLTAVAAFLTTLRHYDVREFLGLRQWRERERRLEDAGGFCISPLHRFVRHPWYFLALILIWTRDMSAAWLVTALAATLYFIIGSRLEERKLLALHGEAYRAYCARVPGLVPLPGRWLSKEEARRLAAEGGRRAS